MQTPHTRLCTQVVVSMDRLTESKPAPELWYDENFSTEAVSVCVCSFVCPCACPRVRVRVRVGVFLVWRFYRICECT
jgi:hypothetical protein